jgi:hypothetical protein
MGHCAPIRLAPLRQQRWPTPRLCAIIPQLDGAQKHHRRQDPLVYGMVVRIMSDLMTALAAAQRSPWRWPAPEGSAPGRFLAPRAPLDTGVEPWP